MPVSEFKTAVICGTETKLYYINKLAERLQRTTTSIRIWERKGIIPETRFRDKYGNRLYTEEQIEAIAKSAEENKIVQGKSIADTNFSVDCHRYFEILDAKYRGKNNG